MRPLTCARQKLRHLDSATLRRIQVKDARTPICDSTVMRDDDIIRRIERFPFRRAPVAAEWRNKGYTLLHAENGAPIARLRPYGRDDLMEILYWSSWKQHWAPTGPFGKTVVPLDQALRIIASSGMF